eukprot:1139334-Pelagomonas_calceolata.AAC.18
MPCMHRQLEELQRSAAQQTMALQQQVAAQSTQLAALAEQRQKAEAELRKRRVHDQVSRCAHVRITCPACNASESVLSSRSRQQAIFASSPLLLRKQGDKLRAALEHSLQQRIISKWRAVTLAQKEAEARAQVSEWASGIGQREGLTTKFAQR